MGRKKQELWVRLMVLLANMGRCVYCDYAESQVIDHVIPLAANGGALSTRNGSNCSPLREAPLPGTVRSRQSRRVGTGAPPASARRRRCVCAA